jgi:uracil-DNA glycosylase
MSWELPGAWSRVLGDELRQPYFQQLRRFVDDERQRHDVYPSAEDMFRAFALTPYERVRVLLLGQDPYHDQGQAHGLCFSVPFGVRPPPSLVNIFRELRDDLGCPIPEHGCLAAWARQGVLLLNTVLTVRAHQPNSHRRRGWERFTDAVIGAVNRTPSPVVFMLWGQPARKKATLVDRDRHAVVQAAHPSPLSTHRGFFGSRPFSAANQALERRGCAPVQWQLPRAAEFAEDC